MAHLPLNSKVLDFLPLHCTIGPLGDYLTNTISYPAIVVACPKLRNRLSCMKAALLQKHQTAPGVSLVLPQLNHIQVATLDQAGICYSLTNVVQSSIVDLEVLSA